MSTQAEPTPFAGTPYLHHQPPEHPAFDPDPEPLLEAAFGTEDRLKDPFRAALAHHSGAAGAVGAAARAEAFSLAAPAALLAPDNHPAAADWPVALAVLDEGLPFARPDLAPRVAGVWAMDAPPDGTLPFGAEITGAGMARTTVAGGRTRAETIYDSFGVNGIAQATGRRMRARWSHGASVLGLAGRHAEPRHPLLCVGFPADVVEDTSGRLLPYFILCGVLYAVARTRALADQIGLDADRGLPLVITISYGVLAGAKSAADPMTRALDTLCAPDRWRVPGLGPVHVVWPLGNGRLGRSHAVLAPGDDRLSLVLLPDDRTPSYVELRSPADGSDACALRARLRLPGDTLWHLTPDSLQPGTVWPMDLPGGHRVDVYARREEAANLPPRDLLVLAFGPTAATTPDARPLPPGCWGLSALSDRPVTIDVQRDDSLRGLGSGGRQPRLDHPAYDRMSDAGRIVDLDPKNGGSPVSRTGTANAYAHGQHAWHVGGAFEREGSLVPYSGLRPADDGSVFAGHVLIPTDRSRVVSGVHVRSVTGTGVYRDTGTSMAAPGLAREIARALSLHARTHGQWPDRPTLARALPCVLAATPVAQIDLPAPDG